MLLYLGKIVPDVACGYQCPDGHGRLELVTSESMVGVHVFRFQGRVKRTVYQLLEDCLLLSCPYATMTAKYGLPVVENTRWGGQLVQRAEPIRQLLAWIAPDYVLPDAYVTPDTFSRTPLFERVE